MQKLYGYIVEWIFCQKIKSVSYFIDHRTALDWK